MAEVVMLQHSIFYEEKNRVKDKKSKKDLM